MLSYSIGEWCHMHGLSRAMFYKLKERGEAPAIFKVGKLTRVSEEANRYWVQQKEAESSRGD